MTRPTDGGTVPDEHEPYEPPPGHGVAHPPEGGTFTVVEQDLIQAADHWDFVSQQLSKAMTEASEGSGRWGLFGFGDQLYSVGKIHAAFNEKAVDAAYDGSTVCAQVADGLIEVANDSAGTDRSQAENFQKLPEKS